MDLRIQISDENDEVLGEVTIYQDGSDSEGTEEIIQWIEQNYQTDPELF